MVERDVSDPVELIVLWLDLLVSELVVGRCEVAAVVVVAVEAVVTAERRSVRGVPCESMDAEIFVVGTDGTA